MKKIEKTYFEHQDLIKTKALKFFYNHNWNRLQLTEIESECNHTFLQCYKNYNPDLSSFKTYLNNSLEYTLMEVQQGLSELPLPVELIRVEHHDNTDSKINFNEWKESLSSDARKVIRAIFKAPLAQISSKRTNKITQKALRNYLWKKGWKHDDITFSFLEIKSALKNHT